MSFTGFRLCITSADALLALALAVSVYCSPVVAANDTIEITVRVRDEAAIPKRIRMLAEKEAGSILEKAGVHVVWVDCVRPAPDSWYCPGGGPLTFGLWMQVAAPARVHSNCLGFAFIGASGEPHATIIYSRILGAAHDTGVDSSSVLGVAIAHELGHLLLQSTEHGTDLMAPRWGFHELVEQASSACSSRARRRN